MTKEVDIVKEKSCVSLPQDEYVIEINEDKRITVAKKKPVFQKRKGFGGYHKRNNQAYMPKKNADRQLGRWRYKLEHLDTQNPMLGVTVTTCNPDLKIGKFKQCLENFIEAVNETCPNFVSYIRRIGITKDTNLFHSHLVLFFNSKHSLQKITKKGVQKHWPLGISVDVKKVYDYAGLRDYLCKEEDYAVFEQDGNKFYKYPYGLRIITSGHKLKKTNNYVRIVTKDKTLAEQMAKERGLNFKHEEASRGLINGNGTKVTKRVYYH